MWRILWKDNKNIHSVIILVALKEKSLHVLERNLVIGDHQLVEDYQILASFHPSIFLAMKDCNGINYRDSLL